LALQVEGWSYYQLFINMVNWFYSELLRTEGGAGLLAVGRVGYLERGSQPYHVGNCATRDRVGRAVFFVRRARYRLYVTLPDTGSSRLSCACSFASAWKPRLPSTCPLLATCSLQYSGSTPGGWQK
jgi:hypothetical protein